MTLLSCPISCSEQDDSVSAVKNRFRDGNSPSMSKIPVAAQQAGDTFRATHFESRESYFQPLFGERTRSVSDPHDALVCGANARRDANLGVRAAIGVVDRVALKLFCQRH